MNRNTAGFGVAATPVVGGEQCSQQRGGAAAPPVLWSGQESARVNLASQVK